MKIYEDSKLSEKHKNIFSAIDVVGFEDAELIEKFVPELLQIKLKFPDTQFVLHAGETVNKGNYNILDAILLGAKRIGHGLPSIQYKYYID